jgi:hypothetical protein
VGPRVGVKVVEKRKIFCPCQESNPDSSAVQPVARRYVNKCYGKPEMRINYMTKEENLICGSEA